MPHASDGSPRILVVDDDAAVGWALQQVLTQAGYQVILAPDATVAQRQLKRQAIDLVITDVRMPGLSGLELLTILTRVYPDLPVVVSTAHGTMETAISAVGQGAFDYLPKPLDLDRTLDVVRRALGDDPLAAAASPDTVDLDQTLVGSSAQMQEVFRRIAAIARTDLAVLLHGPAGSGKELVARALHRHGSRREQPFVTVTCAMIAEPSSVNTFLASEVAAARNGTLFLDEVADLTLPAQLALLQLLASEPPIRVIAATRKDPSKLITINGFRDELASRLRVVTIALPAMGERLDDLPALVRCFLGRMAHQLGRPLAITDEAMQALARRAWPGNVREVKQCLDEAAVLAPGGVIGVDQILASGSEETAGIGSHPGSLAVIITRSLHSHAGAAWQQVMEQVEEQLFRAVLAQTEGNQLRAAEVLGINRITLKKRMDQLGITKP